MSEKEMLDEERAENDLENDNDEMELDDIDLLQLEEEKEDYEAKYNNVLAELQKSNSEKEKMRKALVAHKKKSKSHTNDDDDDLDARLDARIEMLDFYKNNPDAVDHKEEIEAYQKKGVSREDALFLIERKSGESKKTSETRVVGRSKVNVGFQKVSADEYLKMSASAQQNYNKTSEEEYGELVFK
ncbi:MAG: hypothetical protein ACTTH6_01875 [Candidatus Altimarinota bacterium]